MLDVVTKMPAVTVGAEVKLSPLRRHINLLREAQATSHWPGLPWGMQAERETYILSGELSVPEDVPHIRHCTASGIEDTLAEGQRLFKETYEAGKPV
jgi:hypothetical protein